MEVGGGPEAERQHFSQTPPLVSGGYKWRESLGHRSGLFYTILFSPLLSIRLEDKVTLRYTTVMGRKTGNVANFD